MQNATIKQNRPDIFSFRERLAAREQLVGTFLTFGTPHAVELLSYFPFDFVVLDQEHSPFDKSATDAVLFAARQLGVAPFVRVQNLDGILPALDGGAIGVLLPHVKNAVVAQDLAKACRHRGGSRGYGGNARAAHYGLRPMHDHIAHSDGYVTAIAMIEDAEALDCIDEIAATEGVDALFMGRGDLAAALGAQSNSAPEMLAAYKKICDAAARAGKPVCAHFSWFSKSDFDLLRSIGVTAVLAGSDHQLLQMGADAMIQSIRDASK